MPTSVLAIVLVAAALHAIWNALVKGAGDQLLTTILVTSCAGGLAALLLPFLAQPQPESWPFIGFSVVLQQAYFVLLAHAYRTSDMSQAYPLMRGTAPLIVAVMSAVVIGEALTPWGWAGIALICCGLIGLTGLRTASWRGVEARGVQFALLNAVVIAAYTMVDGLGVRRSGAPAAYTLWIFALTSLPLATWAIARHRRAFAVYAVRRLHIGLVAAIGVLASYGLSLWAMTLAPVAMVAALRETSILFATAISILVLREGVSRRRLVMSGVVMAGAAALRLA